MRWNVVFTTPAQWQIYFQATIFKSGQNHFIDVLKFDTYLGEILHLCPTDSAIYCRFSIQKKSVSSNLESVWLASSDKISGLRFSSCLDYCLKKGTKTSIQSILASFLITVEKSKRKTTLCCWSKTNRFEERLQAEKIRYLNTFSKQIVYGGDKLSRAKATW